MATSRKLTGKKSSDQTLSAEGSRVKTLVLLGKGQDFPGSEVGCGTSSPGVLAIYDQDTFSWRTCQRCLFGGWMPFSERWPRSGMMRNGIAYRLTTLACLTSETGFGLLPTLTQCGNHNRKGASNTSGDGIISALNKLLPTLTARDYKSESCSQAFREKRNALKTGKTLPWVLGGILNPRWCEGFMGFPIGWTELKP